MSNISNITARIFFNTCFLAFTVFGLYISFCDAYSYNGDYGTIFVISLISSFIMCILFINSNIWSNIILFVVNAGIIFVIIKNCQLVEKELYVLYEYIKRQYYIYMNLGDLEVDATRSCTMLFGKPIYEKLVFIIIILILILFIAMASFRIKKDFLVLLPVAAVIGMEMLHGKAPSLIASYFFVPGVLGLIFGIKFEMHGGRKNFLQNRQVVGQMWTRYVMFIVIITVSIIVSVQVGNRTKERVFTNSEKALKKQHEIEKEAKLVVETIKVKVLGDNNGYLDNNSPDQMGRFIMRIETDKMPADNIYIRSFYADKYDGKRWRNSDKKPPLSEEDVNYMFSNGIERLLANKSLEVETIETINIDIYPESKKSDPLSYIPYMLKGSEKNASGNYTFCCYNTPSHIKNYILTIDNEEVHDIRKYKKYTSYVDKIYLSLPYNADRLADFADKIELHSQTDLQCIAVKNAICKNTKYSQNLKKLPSGKDYIEYFLFNQKKGYCEHYATAGTVLLRFKGVPARYAAGYNISPLEFNIEYDASGAAKYVAYVKDYNAHAWTEVYKRGFGWIPFDMTNSITDDRDTSNSVLSEPEQDEKFESSENYGQDDGFIQEDINETEEKQKKNNSSSDNSIDKIDQSDRYNHSVKLLVAAGIFMVFLLVAVILAVYNRIKFILLFKKLGLADTSNERVIIYFGILNRFLRFCGFRDISELGDAEYAGKLYSTFAGKIPKASINSACEILQYAAFSNSDVEQILEEEVVAFIKSVSREAYQGCKKPFRFIIYVFTGRIEI